MTPGRPPAWTRAAPGRGRRGPVHVLLCGTYLLLAAWATWPLARDAATHVLDVEALHGRFGLLSRADQLLTIWIHAWDAHALAAHPTRLFEAPIFHPAGLSLARSEHFLGNAPLFAPVYLATGNPVLAHGVAFLLAIALSGAGMYALAWSLTRRLDVAFVCGALYALAPWRLLEGNIQAQLVAYLPLIPLFARRALVPRARASRVALFACLLLQSLCSVYLAVLAYLTCAASLVAFWPWGAGLRRSARALAAAAAPALAAGALLLLVHAPYLLLKGGGELPVSSRTMQELVSASPLESYVRFGDFPGGRYFLSLALLLPAVAGALPASRRGRSRDAPQAREQAAFRRALLLLGAVAFVLSLGPTLRLDGVEVPLPYRLLAGLPGFGSLRGSYRFGIAVTVAAGGLAALGLSRAGVRLPRLGRGALSAVLLAALVAEIGAHAMPLRPLVAEPARARAHAWLAGAEPGPVLALPVGDVARDFRADLWEAHYTYFSHLHWRPLVNGYSSYPPESFRLLAAVARRLPERAALETLVDLAGVRFVVVDEDWLPAWDRARWAEGPLPGLRLAARVGPAAIYEVTLSPRRAPRPGFPDGPRRAHTLFGASRAPLAPADRRAELADLELAGPPVAGLSVTARVDVTNRGGRVWPGVDVHRAGLVALRAAWIPEDASEPVQTGTSRLARDLAPGERVRVPFTLVVPQRAGRYRLRIALEQEGVAPFGAGSGGVSESLVEVVPWGGSEP